MDGDFSRSPDPRKGGKPRPCTQQHVQPPGHSSCLHPRHPGSHDPLLSVLRTQGTLAGIYTALEA